MIDRRSVPAPHRACLHQYEDQPGGREPAGILRLDSLQTDMTASLSLGISHGSFTDRLAWQGPLRSV